MPRDYPRALRVGEQIRRELAQMLRDQVKDPRVQGLTVLEVEVSRDFSHARVFYTQSDDDPQAVAETQSGLQSAAGYLRRELGRRLKIRMVPELRFLFDDTEFRAGHIEALIRSELNKHK